MQSEFISSECFDGFAQSKLNRANIQARQAQVSAAIQANNEDKIRKSRGECAKLMTLISNERGEMHERTVPSSKPRATLFEFLRQEIDHAAICERKREKGVTKCSSTASKRAEREAIQL